MESLMTRGHGTENSWSDWSGGSEGPLDVWPMPRQGIAWCDCGDGHELSEDFVFNTLIDIGLEPSRMLTHEELTELAAAVWNYDGPCRFFELAVDEAAKVIHGTIDQVYPLRHTLPIVGYFSKTWQGCPEAACQGSGAGSGD